jgi:hypothetical protein
MSGRNTASSTHLSGSNFRKPSTFFWFSFGICIFGIYLLIRGCSEHKGDDRYWVMTILGLPLLLQIISLFFLYRKVHKDRSIWNFYWYSMTGMILFFIIIYGFLWLYYPGESIWYELITGIAIMLLLILVAGATYSLMQSPDEFAEARKPRRANSSKWEKFKRAWGHTILLRHMRDCVSKVPFWALLYFFSVFLIVNSFFAFAFAAHYHNVISSKQGSNNTSPPAITPNLPEPKVESPVGPAFQTTASSNQVESHLQEKPAIPPLYLPKLYASEKEKRKYENLESRPKEQKSQINNGKPENQTNREDEKIEEPFEFFFDSDTSYMILESLPASYKGTKDAWEWKKNQNLIHLEKLVNLIDEGTKNNRRVIVQLRGHADDKIPNPNKFPNNQALSETRALVVQIEVLKKLLKKEDRWRDIEWHPLALSSDMPQEKTLDRDFYKDLSTYEDEVIKDIYDSQRDAMNKIYGQIQAIKEINKRSNISQYEGQRLVKLIAHLTTLLRSKPKLDHIPMDKDVEKKYNILEYYVNRIRAVDPDSKKRVVIVSVSSSQDIPVSDFQEYADLNLIDFLYLAWVGSGNIIPTTPYAKFLLSSSKVVDVFFLVVFFNALLAVKRAKRQSPIQIIPAAGDKRMINIATRDLVAMPSADEWINITEVTRNDSNVGVTYSVSEWLSIQPRNGQIYIADEIIHIRQQGVACGFSVSPRNKDFPVAGGQDRITVTTPGICSWKITKNRNWIVISSPLHQQGSGVIEYTVAENNGRKRSGEIRIADQIFKITQNGK